MRFRSTRRQVSNVIRRYQSVVMIDTKQKRSDHRKHKYPKADCGVMRPHDTGSHQRRDQDDYVDEQVLFGRQFNSKPGVGVSVPERGGQVNDYKTSNNNSVMHQASYPSLLMKPALAGSNAD